VVYGANDTRRDVELNVEYGYASFDGSTLETERDIISLPASSKGPVFRFDLGGHDERVGTYYVRPASPPEGKRRRVNGRPGEALGSADMQAAVEPGEALGSAGVEPGALTALLRSGPFRSLDVGPARLEVSGFRNDAQGCRFTVSTDVFAHAVHFGIEEDWRLSDAYFDLLPGESREVRVLGPAGARPTPAAGMEETREAREPMAELSAGSIRPRSVVVR
jgi:beta-mannosidase